MNERRLPWARLNRAYHLDDDVVLARQEFGLVAEVLWTRWLAHGDAICAPEGSEGAVIAGCLGFPADDAKAIGLMVNRLAEIGALTVSRKRGPASKKPGSIPKKLCWDLARREKYRPAERFLTQGNRRSAGQSDRDGTRDDVRDGTREDVRTDVRTKRTNARTQTASAPATVPETAEVPAAPATDEQPRDEGEEHEGQGNGEAEAMEALASSMSDEPTAAPTASKGSVVEEVWAMYPGGDCGEQWLTRLRKTGELAEYARRTKRDVSELEQIAEEAS